jgi:hypothetical protein
MEQNISSGVFESGLYEFLAFTEGLIKEALVPYKDQIKGKWAAQEIHESVVQAYERAATISQFVYSRAENEGGSPFHQDKGIKEVAFHLAREIDQAIVSYFARHGQGVIWVPDFNAYAICLFEKLSQILYERKIFTKNLVSSHRVKTESH